MKIVIDKESIIKAFTIAFYAVTGGDYSDVKDAVKEVLEKIGYEPYEERPQGKWIDTNEAYIVNEDGKRIPNSGISECSVCKQRVSPLFMGARNFCPNCGADMRGEEER